jgi:hypothetical protein
MGCRSLRWVRPPTLAPSKRGELTSSATRFTRNRSPVRNRCGVRIGRSLRVFTSRMPTWFVRCSARPCRACRPCRVRYCVVHRNEPPRWTRFLTQVRPGRATTRGRGISRNTTRTREFPVVVGAIPVLTHSQAFPATSLQTVGVRREEATQAQGRETNLAVSFTELPDKCWLCCRPFGKSSPHG